MSIALTIGIILTIIGMIGYIQDTYNTILDNLNYAHALTIGIIVLINCLIHYLIK